MHCSRDGNVAQLPATAESIESNNCQTFGKRYGCQLAAFLEGVVPYFLHAFGDDDRSDGIVFLEGIVADFQYRVFADILRDGKLALRTLGTRDDGVLPSYSSPVSPSYQ